MGKSAIVFFGLGVLMTCPSFAEAGVRVSAVKMIQPEPNGYTRGKPPKTLGLEMSAVIDRAECMSEREWLNGHTSKVCHKTLELMSREDLTEVQNQLRHEISVSTATQEQRVAALQGELLALREDQLKAIAALNGQGVSVEAIVAMREQIREMVREELAAQGR